MLADAAGQCIQHGVVAAVRRDSKERAKPGPPEPSDAVEIAVEALNERAEREPAIRAAGEVVKRSERLCETGRGNQHGESQGKCGGERKRKAMCHGESPFERRNQRVWVEAD